MPKKVSSPAAISAKIAQTKINATALIEAERDKVSKRTAKLREARLAAEAERRRRSNADA